MKIKAILRLLASFLAVKVYKKRNDTSATYRNLKRLNSLYHKKASYHYELFKLAYNQGKWKESLTHIDNAIKHSGNSLTPDFYLNKAEVLEKLKLPSKAVENYNKYMKLVPQNDEILYKLANDYYEMKKWDKAIEFFKIYLKRHPNDLKVNYALAECFFYLHEHKKAEQYFKYIINSLDNKKEKQIISNSYYKIGLIALKENDQKEADKLFNLAIKFDRKLNSKTLGIGTFHERYNYEKYALEAYENKIIEDEENTELFIKLASLYKSRHNFEQAIIYYEKLLKLDKTKIEWHYALAQCYEEIKNYSKAALWYESTIDRDLKHNPNTYKRLGSMLAEVGEYEKAIQTYQDADLFAKVEDVSREIYKNNISKPNIRYGISYTHYSVNSKMVFYESMSGGRMMGNPYAIFERLIDREYFQDYIHVWVVNSLQVIPDEYKSNDNIIFVKRDTDAYYKYISSAKYLICNSTFATYVTRKPNQIYLQTSHGIFYKTVGRDSANTPLGVAGGTRNLLQATHIIVPNEFMVNKQPKSYSIEGIHAGEIAKVGYPRIDVTVNLSEKNRNRIMNQLGIDNTKKTVFYAPTWRGDSKVNNRFDSNQLVNDLKLLATLDVNVVFRGHPITNSLLKDVKLPKNIIVPTPDIQTNELLGMSDILISDYSSVFFDFIVTEKPIIHYLYDKEDYTKERGLNLEDDELPGDIAETSEQLISVIKEKLRNDQPSSNYLKSKDRFSPYDDGKSAEKVIDWLFYEKKQNIKFVKKDETKKTYIYIGGFLDDIDIGQLVNEMNQLVNSNNSVSLIVNKQVAKNKKKMIELSQLNYEVNTIVHDKRMPATIEELNAINYFDKHQEFIDSEMEQKYKAFFKRQARRLFGDTYFDEVVNCVGKSNYWLSLKESILVNKDKIKVDR